MLPTDFYKEQELKRKPKVDIFANVGVSLLENYIKKSNLTALKILFYLSGANVKVTSNKDDTLHTFKLNVNIVCKFCNIEKQTLYRNLKKMQETSITLKDGDKISYYSILPRIKLMPGTSKLEVDMFNIVFKLAKAIKCQYANINLENLMKSKSKNVIRILSILEKLNNYDNNIPKRKRYTLEELNGIFDTNYKRIGAIEKEILKPSKIELDTFSKLTFIYQINYDKAPEKKGRPKAVSVTIDLIQKNTVQGRLI